MRRSLGFGSGTLSMGAALVGAAVVLVAQPTLAASTQVTNIKVQETGSGVNVALETKSGNRPQIFTVSQGKTWMADIINTQLRLPTGSSFRQDNPAPGISSVVVIPLSKNTVRVVVTGQNGSPTGVAARRGSNGLLISLNRSQAGQGAAQAPAAPSGGTIAPIPVAQAPAPSQRPNVLVPDPKVIIDGVPATPPQQANVAPAFLRRAAAPPVGDIAISNIDASASAIDLGSAERVPRLVLRDAPAREVLALLARAAGLNLAFTTDAGGQPGQPAAQPGATATGPTISLDIENESVQDVFNYVLRLSNLQANRVGRTIFVGSRLPNAAQDLVIRSFRLNQVAAEQASGFLVSMGAESAITQTQPVTTVTAVAVPGSTTPITQTSTTNQTVVNTLSISPTFSVPLLRGLQVLVDTRTNSVTLVGPRRLVEVASSQLLQLDLRRRQVAVNVKIIDVNLTGTDSFRGSIGFGINDTYVTSDGGATSINFGSFRPPTATEASGLNSQPIITNPITGTPSISATDTFNIQGSTFPRPGAPLSSSGDPTQPIITNFTPETGTVTFNNGTPIVTTTPATATFALPALFQFPSRLLVSLQAQVIAGNAKILTDPTLVVQEGQAASVNLTQDVVANVTTQTSTSTPPVITQTANIQPAGLTLAVNVERIDDNGFVTLSVAPRVTAVANTQTFGTTQIALLATRSLSSGTIRLRDGQTLILSGIIQEQERTQVSKIPILGDLPLIGALFRSTSRSDQRAEVIVLLTPQILDDSDQSVMGYSYTPGPEARQILRRGGSNTQGR